VKAKEKKPELKKPGWQRVAIALAAVVLAAALGMLLLSAPKSQTGYAALLAGIDENTLYKSITAQLARATVTDSGGSIEAMAQVQGQDTSFAEIRTDENSTAGRIEAEFNAGLPEGAAVSGASITISYGLSTQKALAAAVGGPAEDQTGIAVQAIAIVAGIIIVAMVVYFLVIVPKG
jgi:hypothetical protein